MLFALALAWFASFAPPALQAGAPADPAMEAAKTLKAKGAHHEALAAFGAICEAEPRSSPRRVEALVESGVCRFAIARAAMVLHRLTDEAEVAYWSALECFELAMSELPKSAFASRAAYLRGSTFLFLGELAQSEKAYEQAF